MKDWDDVLAKIKAERGTGNGFGTLPDRVVQNAIDRLEKKMEKKKVDEETGPGTRT